MKHIKGVLGAIVTGIVVGIMVIVLLIKVYNTHEERNEPKIPDWY